mmetsp:Transcript_50811/g.94650  ORF Transcript_50811/g.94650 Transcript_50811/m.94650 type:complete len:248 (-) Transcript_50811:288-1031(-)
MMAHVAGLDSNIAKALPAEAVPASVAGASTCSGTILAQRNSRGTPKAPYIRNNAGQPYFMRIIGDAKSPRSVPAWNPEKMRPMDRARDAGGTCLASRLFMEGMVTPSPSPTSARDAITSGSTAPAAHIAEACTPITATGSMAHAEANTMIPMVITRLPPSLSAMVPPRICVAAYPHRKLDCTSPWTELDQPNCSLMGMMAMDMHTRHMLHSRREKAHPTTTLVCWLMPNGGSSSTDDTEEADTLECT